jgi:hypothetical protein
MVTIRIELSFSHYEISLNDLNRFLIYPVTKKQFREEQIIYVIEVYAC